MRVSKPSPSRSSRCRRRTWNSFVLSTRLGSVLDSERVLVLGRFGGRGRTSGVEIGQIWTQGASVFHIRAGQVTRLVLYTDYKRAVADLGLSN